MAWMEACALNAARCLGPAWSTVAVDGLEFAHPVLVGE
jgi:acyl-CoA hydrolase